MAKRRKINIIVYHYPICSLLVLPYTYFYTYFHDGIIGGTIYKEKRETCIKLEGVVRFKRPTINLINRWIGDARRPIYMTPDQKVRDEALFSRTYELWRVEP